MSLTHRMRTHVRRTALLALATSGVAVAGLGAGVSPASAHSAGSYEINNYRHFAGLTQEVGSDEFYILTVNFQVQLGVSNSFKVWGNSPYEIDDIDDEEKHSVDARMGQAKFDIGAWSPIDMVFNKGPYVFGSVTQMFEKDTAPWSAIHSIHNSLIAALQNELKLPLETASPYLAVVGGGAELIKDFVDPRNAPLRDDIIQGYIKSKVIDVVAKTVKKAGIWNLLSGYRDDVVGDPHFTLVAGVENISTPAFLTIPALTFNIANAFENAVVNAGYNKPEGDQIFALPQPGVVRNYTQQYKGTRYKIINSSSKPRYVMSVRAGKL